MSRYRNLLFIFFHFFNLETRKQNQTILTKMQYKQVALKHGKVDQNIVKVK